MQGKREGQGNRKVRIYINIYAMLRLIKIRINEFCLDFSFYNRIKRNRLIPCTFTFANRNI